MLNLPLPRRLGLLAVPAVVALLLVLVAGGAPAGAKVSRTLGAKENPPKSLKFTKKKLKVSAGKVTFVMKNAKGNQFPHAIAIDGKGVDKSGPIAQPGKTTKFSVKLKKGTYTFYCPVGQHRQAGMVGKLTVK